MTHDSQDDAAGPARPTLRPYGLRAEQRETPLGLGVKRPRLSWRLACERRGAAQGAYRITVARRPEDLDGGPPVWDSGRVAAGDGVLVPWRGADLESSTRYHWRVAVWDEAGSPAGAERSWFELRSETTHRRPLPR